MDKDTIAGAAKQAAGSIERGAGRLTGSGEGEIRGAAHELGGAAQRTYGEVKDEVRDLAGGRSAASLLGAVAVGLVIGLFLNRR